MRKAFQYTFLFFIFAIIGYSGVVVYDGYGMYKHAISEISIEQKVEMIRGDEGYLTMDKISPSFIDAIVSVEDRRFFSHDGIDKIAILRATVNNIKSGELVQGGSTITQQLSKNMYFDGRKRFERKVAELFLVRDIENTYSKGEILELYVNVIYYGDGNTGIKEASNNYFGKEPINLTLKESAMLAGLPKAPSYYALSNNYSGAHERMQQVLNCMVENKAITLREALLAFEDNSALLISN